MRFIARRVFSGFCLIWLLAGCGGSTQAGSPRTQSTTTRTASTPALAADPRMYAAVSTVFVADPNVQKILQEAEIHVIYLQPKFRGTSKAIPPDIERAIVEEFKTINFTQVASESPGGISMNASYVGFDTTNTASDNAHQSVLMEVDRVESGLTEDPSKIKSVVIAYHLVPNGGGWRAEPYGIKTQ
ncbi:MAG: hypothetical protein NVS2B7_40150 [Herpetosiphon sp.]